MISSPGLGSGLNVSSIVQQIMQIEAEPGVRLENRKAANQIKISGFGQINSALSDFQSKLTSLKDESSLVSYNATSSDTDVFTITNASATTEKSHTIEVVDLADAHRLNSVLFTGESEVVGEGALTLTSGGTTIALTIDSSNNTVTGIRDAINNATENTSIRASTVNVDGGTRLILTAENSGSANAVGVSVTGDSVGTDIDTSGLSRLVFDDGVTENMTELQAADDGLVRIDGFDVTAESNVISDVITGVTITLVDAGTAELNVVKNNSVISNSLQALVKSYNELRTTLDDLSSGTLQGENFILNLERSLRDVFTDRVFGLGASIESVFDIGLSFDRYGVLSFDSSKLESALTDNPDSVVSLLSDDDNGFAVKLDNLVGNYLGVGGLLESRTDGLENRNKDLDAQILTFSERLSQKEKRLYQEYSALDALMAQLTSTGSFLTSQLDQLSSLLDRRK